MGSRGHPWVSSVRTATKALSLETRRGPPDQVVGMKSKPTQNPGPGEDAPALPGRGNSAGFGLAGRKAGERTTLLNTTNALRGGEA